MAKSLLLFSNILGSVFCNNFGDKNDFPHGFCLFTIGHKNPSSWIESTRCVSGEGLFKLGLVGRRVEELLFYAPL